MDDKSATMILESDGTTGILYKIEGGMDVRDKDEIEAMDSNYVVGLSWQRPITDSLDIRHRLRYMRKRGLGLRYVKFLNANLESFLTELDPGMPILVAAMLVDFYYYGTVRLSDLVTNMKRENRLEIQDPIWSGKYETLTEELIRSLMDLKGVPHKEMTRSDLFDSVFLMRCPVGHEGNMEIIGERPNEFHMVLALRIGLKV